LQDGNTPLDNAEKDDVKAVLREHGGKHSLFGAGEKNMPEDVAELIKEGADVNQQNQVRGAGPQMETLHMCRLRIDVRM